MKIFKTEIFQGGVTVKILTVKDVLKEIPISRAQLYYWEEAGKIPLARRTSTGKRYFLPADLAKLKKLFQAARLGKGRYRG